MPLVRIDMIKGHTEEYKKQFLNAVHDGLELALGIPEWDRFQRLNEIDNEYFERSAEKSADFCIIELTLFLGRSKETKGKVITEITRLLVDRLHIKPTDIFIIINEPPFENWGFGGVQKEG